MNIKKKIFSRNGEHMAIPNVARAYSLEIMSGKLTHTPNKLIFDVMIGDKKAMFS